MGDMERGLGDGARKLQVYGRRKEGVLYRAFPHIIAEVHGHVRQYSGPNG